MEKTTEYVKAREKAIRYIMYKTRTSFEIYNKLLELEFAPHVISAVIQDLINLDYINDERYVKKFIESEKKLKKISKSMIKLKLKNKGIDSEIIDKYLLEISDVEAIKKILKKKNFNKDMEYDEKNKIKAYCIRKGFSLSDFNKAEKEYFE